MTLGRAIATAGLLGLLTLAAMPAQADLRCNRQVVNVGDRAFEVLHKCGEPLFVDRWHVGVAYGALAFRVEEWFYNFSRSSLTRMLRFRNGRLVRIETGGYGFGGGCAPSDIGRGLSKLELLARCGLPVQREARTEFRVPRRPHRLSFPGRVHRTAVPVRVEEWVYTFGAHQLVRFVTLVDGRVFRVETGERLD